MGTSTYVLVVSRSAAQLCGRIGGMADFGNQKSSEPEPEVVLLYPDFSGAAVPGSGVQN